MMIDDKAHDVLLEHWKKERREQRRNAAMLGVMLLLWFVTFVALRDHPWPRWIVTIVESCVIGFTFAVVVRGGPYRHPIVVRHEDDRDFAEEDRFCADNRLRWHAIGATTNIGFAYRLYSFSRTKDAALFKMFFHA